MTRPETSIVIRTFNEERDLPRLLEAIHEQRYVVVSWISGSGIHLVQVSQAYAKAAEHLSNVCEIESEVFVPVKVLAGACLS